ncbi:MAG TPA: sulfatase [Armatimonadetes bacterium]|jgi:arylsulfatase A-like enzyme|nr:sulfatase [Armatimonadota bacterium]
MRAIMLMYDSLNRRMLPPYGCDWVHAPNFQRLAERSVTFTNSFVGSMPCMPARREIHTGRYNFLHRAWGPLEPFDDSMPRMLKRNGIHSHLVSDHYHYWEDGGCTYHTQYKTWEISRGQEGDVWKGDLTVKDLPQLWEGHASRRASSYFTQDQVNRKYMQREEHMPQRKTFEMGLEFMRTNRDEDNWMLHIETFDPHEPFYTLQRYKDLYPHEYDGPLFDWPVYGPVTEPRSMVDHCRLEYAALVTMCDTHLGMVLDAMDQMNLWDDTLLIVNTDHGFLLGEHDFWAKCSMPFYNEVAHTPFFIWDPRSKVAGQRRDALVQTIDIAPTMLEYFGIDRTPDMQGVPLKDTVVDDTQVRQAGLYGIHGGHVNCTDGRYVYMRACATEDNQPLCNYTLMPTHMRGFFSHEELSEVELAEPFSFTGGLRTMRTPGGRGKNIHEFGTMLFDLQEDPGQEHPLDDPDVEDMMIDHLIREMRANDAPAEQYTRLGLEDRV